MTRKIFHAILLSAAAALALSMVIVIGCLYEYFGRVQETQMKDELSLAAAGVSAGGEEYLSRLAPSDHYRLTWIAPDGTVRLDTRAGAEEMDNHAGRAEIREALAMGDGESVRYSATLLEKTMYCARRLDDGSVLRISVSRTSVGMLALGILQPILWVILAALALAALLAGRLSRRIIEPLNRLDLEHPLDNDAYEELAPLLHRINAQRGQIDAQLRELERRTSEFRQITDNMREGLVLLDGERRVLSVNETARRLFQADDDCVGQDFLTLDRSPDMSAAIAAAMQEGHAVLRAVRGARRYQLDVSRIDSDGKAAGAVLLAVDVTEQEEAEQRRREFSANVSHELKTPLQGIIGSAELIENGLVQPADLPRFAGHIRAEGQRLVTLIGDIIRLSQLDENVDMPRERVDLLALARETARDLSEAAEKKRVTINVAGTETTIWGVRRLLYEMLYNLCDNAIRYNRADGHVNVRVGAEERHAVVTVEDDGAGIAPEHQQRVFERFYRVDKSHSKASGGTGLGLSIVKHAVQYHGGAVSLHSAPGEGTSVRVELPATEKPENNAEAESARAGSACSQTQ